MEDGPGMPKRKKDQFLPAIEVGMKMPQWKRGSVLSCHGGCLCTVEASRRMPLRNEDQFLPSLEAGPRIHGGCSQDSPYVRMISLTYPGGWHEYATVEESISSYLPMRAKGCTRGREDQFKFEMEAGPLIP
jgi:hypothetical protein